MIIIVVIKITITKLWRKKVHESYWWLLKRLFLTEGVFTALDIVFRGFFGSSNAFEFIILFLLTVI